MVCTEVCDAQEPAVSTICAREIDPTTSPTHMSEPTTALDLRRATALPGGPVRAHDRDHRQRDRTGCAMDGVGKRCGRYAPHERG